MTLVASIKHHDLDPTRAAEGAQLLRRYLDYAASEGARLNRIGLTSRSSIPTSPAASFSRSSARFHRIWSTDWFLRRDEELSRALDAYARAVEYADRTDAQAERDAQAIILTTSADPYSPPISTGSSSGSSRTASSAPTKIS
jgi:hypothetical protein